MLERIKNLFSTPEHRHKKKVVKANKDVIDKQVAKLLTKRIKNAPR